MRGFAEWIETTRLSATFVETSWVVPTLQSIHILSIAVIFSTVLMIDLRVLGWTGKGQTIAQTLKRFAPWFWAALIALAVTGLGLIVAEPVRELTALSFWVKMALLALGIVIAISLLRHARGNAVLYDGGQTMSQGNVRTIGWLTLIVWIAIIFLGRFIAYDAQIWGPLSPQY